MSPDPRLSEHLGLPSTFHGMRVIESQYLEQNGEPFTVRRPWRERLFSRPWRPFVATRLVVLRVPYRGFVTINATTIAMHPETLRKARHIINMEQS